MKLVIAALAIFSLNALASDHVIGTIAQQPSAHVNTIGTPPEDLKTPNQEVIEKHHTPGGALKVKKDPVKIEGLNSTPAEKAATEKAIKEAKKKKQEEQKVK